MNFVKALISVLIVASVSIAQGIKISGKVTERTGTAISGALVKLEKGGQTAITGADGNFTLLGNAGSVRQFSASLPYMRFTLTKNSLRFDVDRKSAVEITIYTLQGKTLSKIQETIDIGSHCVALPRKGAGVYLYKIKSENSEFLTKISSFGRASGSVPESIQSSSSGPLTKLASTATSVSDPFNDVIAVTKTGYLHNKLGITNPDTSGIEIKLIVSAGTVTDTDGNIYQTVAIGSQIWMAENLKTTRYNNGAAIPLVTDNAAWSSLTAPKYCWADNDSAANKNTYGALYNWYAVNTGALSPAGWHVATDAEWNTLINYLGGIYVAGAKLKEAGTAHWLPFSSPYVVAATNESGFTALPGGDRDLSGTFSNTGDFGFWWSSTAYADTVHPWFSWSRYMDNLGVGREFDDRSFGCSVRCVKD
jgi:uncharacterized protein (TIGR02145 family)